MNVASPSAGRAGDAFAGMPADVAALLSAAAVRSRCRRIYEAGLGGRLAHFGLHPERLDACVEYVIETTRAHYASWDEVPYHSRWRHFEVDGIDRWAWVRTRLGDASPDELARTAIDLVVVSVLLDAGAGPEWRYRERATRRLYARSEGLAVASVDAFLAGCFSSNPARPHQADANGLVRVSADTLADAMQVGPGNPLVGLDGRAELLQRLGAALAAQLGVVDGDSPRVGQLYDRLRQRAEQGRLPAAVVLEELLWRLGAVWPGARWVSGVPLGDVGYHRAIGGDGATAGLVPFHKLSQWLAYSLVEPLEWGGLEVVDLDGLTGLAEYRNGGLFIDLGVLEPRHAELQSEPQPVDGEAVVEWRALTLILLDELAERIRARLGMDAQRLPLAKILQGGTWQAGRRIAAERRAEGGPPIRLASDGTVF